MQKMNLLKNVFIAVFLFSAIATASARNKYLFEYFSTFTLRLAECSPHVMEQ